MAPEPDDRGQRPPAADLAQPDEIVTEHARRPAARSWYLLLLVPFIAVLWVPFYASSGPELFGFPFFYWYQLAWVPLTALLTWLVFTRVR